MTPTEGSPLWLVAPFFVVAPLGLVAAGLLLATSESDSFVAINLPRTVAVTHTLVIGWITTTIMGATYQLGPAVLGGRLLSNRLAAVQFMLHVVAVPLFVWSLLEWQTRWMSIAGVLLALSLSLYVVNAWTSLLRGKSWSLPRAYLLVSLVMLCVTMAFGVTWVLALDRVWFPITMGRLSAHAHLGLAGWLAVTVMGVSYQLVPMFNVVHQWSERIGRACLAWMCAAVALFAGLMLSDPGAELRLAAALSLVLAPTIWAIDQWRLMQRRSRRKLDVQGRATLASLVLLALTVPAAIAAAVGTPGTPNAEPARWLLAYAALGLTGWIGLTLVGNTYKILPFLVWFHRYRPLIGRAPVPTTSDLYSDRAATAIAGCLVVASVVLAGGALGGELTIFRAGGMFLALTGAAHLSAVIWILLPRPVRPAPATPPIGVTT